jgi:hypothetical protein
MSKDIVSTSAFSAASGDPAPPPEKPVDNTTRKAWNDYVGWLDKRGLKGHPSLDHNELGFKMIDQYRKEHPDTPLTKDMVIPIQQEFSRYRTYAMNQIKANKGAYAPGVTDDSFMKQLSIVDGIPGQRTTSYSFPEQYLKTFENGKLVSTQDQGYAVAKQP